MVGLLANTKRAHAEVPFPGLLLPVSPSLWRAPADLNLCRGPSNTSRQIWLSLLWGQCSFPLGLGTHKILCHPRVESSFPSVLWKSCNQILLAFKVRFPGDSQSLCPIIRLGSLTWGSEPSQQWENLYGIIVFQFVGCLSSKYEI